MTDTPSLSAVADRYRAALDAPVWEFPIDGLDRLGVPVATATVIDDAGRLLANGVGYGESPEEARVSALGEALEDRWAQARVPGLTRRTGSFADLAPEGAVDPVALIVDAGTENPRTREREWIAVRSARDPGAPRLVPVEWVAHSPAALPAGYAPWITPITNGLGAGDTHERALLHGLLELLQRDGNSVGFRALDRRVAVADAGLGDILRDRGIAVTVKAAYLDRGLTVVHAVGDESEPPANEADPLVATACGEAADPDPARAIRKALLELAASRARKIFSHRPLARLEGIAPPEYLELAARRSVAGEEPRALEAMRDWTRCSTQQLRELVADPILAVSETIAFDDLPVLTREPGIPERLAAVLGLLEDQGLEPLWIDLSPPGGEVHVVKAIVPGLEVETVSYGRLGPRNLQRLLDRDISWVGRGAPPSGALVVPLPDDSPAWLDPEGMSQVLGRLYPLYREPSRHAVALSEPPFAG